MKLVAKGIENKAFPGCQLLVAKNNSVIWNKCYGDLVYGGDDKKVKPDDLYDLASITKVGATTLAIMKLYDKKKLDLTKTVGDYLPLPEDATIKNLRLSDVLTHHKAGLKAFFVFYKATTGNNFNQYYRKMA